MIHLSEFLLSTTLASGRSVLALPFKSLREICSINNITHRADEGHLEGCWSFSLQLFFQTGGAAAAHRERLFLILKEYLVRVVEPILNSIYELDVDYGRT